MQRILTIALLLTAALGMSPAGALAAPGSMAVCGDSGHDVAHCDAVVLVHRGSRVPLRPAVRPVPAAGRTAHRAGAGAGPVQAGSPQWLQQAYDLTALSATRGAGDTIAIVDAFDDPGAASDLATFRQTYGLPACSPATGCLQILNQSGQSAPLPAASTAWATEETLDLQAVSAICPLCHILLIEADSADNLDLATAMQTAVDLGANQISDSWSITGATNPFPTWLTPAHPGAGLPAVFAAAGDSGTDPAGSAEYPAALAQVTAVGGTTLTETNSAQNPRGLTESAWSDAGSGCALGGLPVALQPATGCLGRAYSDISADADPLSGLNVYEAADGGWATAGGTSLATPVVAAFAALTGVDAAAGPGWAYADAHALNQPSGGSNGTCAAGLLSLMCAATGGFSGPTGIGSISGAVVPGTPGICAPTFQSGEHGSDLAGLSPTGAQLAGGLYPNGEATSYRWQWGPTSAYGHLTPLTSAGAGTSAVLASATLSGLAAGRTYHYRLVATNAAGTSVGPDETFTTPAAHATAARRPRAAVKKHRRVRHLTHHAPQP